MVIVEDALKEITAATMKQSVVESITESLKTAAEDTGMSEERIAYWQTQMTAISAAIDTAVNNLISAVAGRFAGAEVQDNQELEVEEQTKALTDLIAEASAKLQELGEEQTAAAVLPPTKPNKSGVYKISIPIFKRAMFGMPIRYHANKKGGGTVRRSSVEASASDTEGVFLNSMGKPVTNVPDESSNDVMPGFVTLAAYMEAGETYEPIIATTIEATEENTELETETKESVTYTEEKLIASTATFSTNVDEALLAGTRYNIIPASAVELKGWEDNANEAAAKVANKSFDIYTLLALPCIYAPTETTWYIAAVSFDRGDNTSDYLYNNSELEFYPNNVLYTKGTAQALKYVEGEGFVELTAKEILDASGRYTQGYLAFQLEGNTPATRPVVTVNLSKVIPDTPDTPYNPEPTPDTPTSTPGSSGGGGCDAGFGFGAFVMMMLAAMIRREKR